jgi:ribonuclease HI
VRKQRRNETSKILEEIWNLHKKITIYSDGGSRGNPGPAAAAYLLLSESGNIIKAQSHYLGRRTNNQAEYEALIAALEAAAQLGAQEVTCYSDSELVCKHFTGEYQVKNLELLKLWKKTQELKRKFKQVTVYNVLRTNLHIQEADKLVNLQLDEAKKHQI